MRNEWLPSNGYATFYQWNPGILKLLFPGSPGPWAAYRCRKMYHTMDILTTRKKKVPNRFLPNTYRLFNENLIDVRLDENKISRPALFKKSSNPPPHPRSPSRNNMPHPINIKFIQGNVRFLNEPITFTSTANTNNKQVEWWPCDQQSSSLHKPSYDRVTTQRNDFCNLAYSGRQTRHGCNPYKAPLHGIVPLASPRSRNRLPKLLQEEISFLHQYDSRLTPNEPIRGKRHGSFVWREIKTESGSVVPQGSSLFLNARGSHALEQPQTERGNLVESSMTSPNLSVLRSQQMFNSEAHLSKTELRDTAKTYPKITIREQNNSGSFQTARRKTLAPIGELLSGQAIVKPL
ncbi:ciliary microtubule inner protein 6 [Mixophyes fleayi]|uniref:ciliary microtubule inner protein 6 n=1 Tax=Mixophyes fleayi TaxID=3061075 RepID=UPI003F4DB925